ncbi:MAG: DUF2726 domain-containing protein [Anaerolineae bacterium]|nr:DUF2726 domain-containing protein [Anaerolineae bacterium]
MKIAVIAFLGIILIGAGLGITLLIYTIVRKFSKESPELGLARRGRIVVPSDSTLAMWGGQLIPNEYMMDLAESNIFTGLEKVILGELSLRYGDRFRLLYKVDAKRLVKVRPGLFLKDSDLLRAVDTLRADYVVCTDTGGYKPVIVVMLWDGDPRAINNKKVCEYRSLDRRRLHTEDQINKWALAGILSGCGIPVFYVSWKTIEIQITPEGLKVEDILQEELSNAIGSVDFDLR